MHKIDAHSLELCVAVFLYSQRKPAHFPILIFVVVFFSLEAVAMFINSPPPK